MRPKILRPEGKYKIKGGFMCSANHCSFLDPIVIHCTFWNRRIYSLATKDLFNTPFKQWMFEKMHCIMVDKDNFSLSSLHEVIKQLKRGKVVSIFPEGYVHVGEKEISAFKSGTILMAHTANVPVVPVYIVPAAKWYQRRATVVGAPINIREVCGDRPSVAELDAAADYIRSKNQELKQYYENKYSCGNAAQKEGDRDV
jgi:1-acyl-sn-glycerol-3-phosphate acyltransferase